MSNQGAPPKGDVPAGFRAYLGRTLAAFSSPERKRLASDIELARRAIADPSTPAAKLLEDALRAARAGDLDDGWKFLHRAQRLDLEARTGEELDIALKELTSEASEKLRGWRKDAVLSLLAGKPTAKALAEARRLFDEQNDNTYFRNRLLRTQILVAASTLLFGLLVLFCTIARIGELPDVAALSIAPSAVALSMVFGLIAASMSALVTFTSTSTEQRIPERLANVMVTFVRPLVGAASGMVGLLALKANIVSLPPGSIGWLVPFAFGFSERLVMGALSLVGGQKS